MREQAHLRAAPVKLTARVYSIPAPSLYRAVAAGELKTCCVGGRRTVLLFSEVEEWLRQHPAKLLTMKKGPTP
jgi:hypothetical protein